MTCMRKEMLHILNPQIYKALLCTLKVDCKYDITVIKNYISNLIHIFSVKNILPAKGISFNDFCS